MGRKQIKVDIEAARKRIYEGGEGIMSVAADLGVSTTLLRSRICPDNVKQAYLQGMVNQKRRRRQIKEENKRFDSEESEMRKQLIKQHKKADDFARAYLLKASQYREIADTLARALEIEE